MQTLILIASLMLGVLPSTPSRVEYTAAGGTQYTFSFKTLATSHVKVFVNDVPQTIGFSTALNVNQDSSPGGTVTFFVAPLAGSRVRIERTMPVSNDSVWTAFTKAKSLELDLDRSAMRDQQLDRDMARLNGRSCSPGQVLTSSDGVNVVCVNDNGSSPVADASTVTAEGGYSAMQLRDYFANGVVQASVFGLNPDPVADQTAAFLRMRTFLQTHDGATVVFKPGQFNTTRGDWLQGIRNVRIIGRGTKIKNIAPATGYVTWSTAALITNVTYFENGWGSAELTQKAPTYRFNTAAARGKTITLTTAGDTSNFAVGNRVFLYGYRQQTGGWPTNPRYYEIKTIRSIGTGTLTFWEGLRYDYDQRWGDFTDVYGTAGAPRVINLDRPEYVLGESLYMEGIEFLRATNDWQEPDRNRGYTNFAGIRKVTLKDVKAGILGVSVVEDFVAEDCEADEIEPDKIIDRARFKNCKIGKFSGAGAGAVIVEDSDILSLAAPIGGPQVTFTRCNFYASYSTIQAVVLGGSVRLIDCNFYRAAADPTTNALVSPSYGENRTITVDAVPLSTLIEASYVNTGVGVEPTDVLRKGHMLYKADGSNEGVIDAIYQSTTGRVAVAASFRNAPVVGDVLTIAQTRELVMRGNLEYDGSSTWKHVDQTAFRPGRVESYLNDVEEGRRRRITVPLPLPGGANLEIGGIITEFEAHVVTTGVGTLHIYSPTGGSGDESFDYQINTATIGARKMTAYEVRGAVAGDALGYLPEGRWQRRIAIFATGLGASASGYLTVEYIVTPWRNVTVDTPAARKLHPPTDAGAAQTGAVFQGSGVPNNSNGSDGDVYFRTDTPGTPNQRLYIRSGGSWTGVL